MARKIIRLSDYATVHVDAKRNIFTIDATGGKVLLSLEETRRLFGTLRDLDNKGMLDHAN